jgi:hypothetical protein
MLWASAILSAIASAKSEKRRQSLKALAIVTSRQLALGARFKGNQA